MIRVPGTYQAGIVASLLPDILIRIGLDRHVRKNNSKPVCEKENAGWLADG